MEYLSPYFIDIMMKSKLLWIRNGYFVDIPGKLAYFV